MYDGQLKTYPANIIAFTKIEDILPLIERNEIVIDYKKMADRVIKKPLLHYVEEEIKEQKVNTLDSFFK